MAIEQIRQITQTEEQADQLRKASIMEAKQMTADAEGQAAQLLEEAQRQGEEVYKKILQEAQIEAEHHYDDIIRKANQHITHRVEAAEQNLDSAVSIIIRKVVK